MSVPHVENRAMSNDDGSSSEDEVTKRILKDSIDDDLLTNDLYNNSSEKPSDEMKRVISLPTKPSLRDTFEDKGYRDHNFIKVTPTFQDFVAEKLSKHLENQIIEKKSKHKKHKVDNTDAHPKKGIYLFNGSTKLLNCVTNEPARKMKRVKGTSSKLILQRASEAAVLQNDIDNWLKEK